MMAEDYIKMGMARVEKVDLPEPYQLENPQQKDSGDRRRHHRYVGRYRRGQGRL
jgi:hypothetical protein